MKSPLVKNREIWLMGDLNVDTRKRNSTKCKRMFTFIKRRGLKYLNTRPTYFHPHGKSTLDHTYTNCPFVSENGVLNDMFGDHAPTYVVKKQDKVVKKPLIEITGRSYKGYSAEVTSRFVTNTDWHLGNDDNAVTCYSKIIDSVSVHLDAVHPVRKFKIRPCRPDGFTKEIELLLKRKKVAFRKCRKVPTGVFNTYLPQVRNIDKQVKYQLIVNQRNDIRSKLVKFANDPKRFWAEVNTVWKGPRETITLNLVDDTGVRVPKDGVADFVNNYYVNIGQTLAESFGHVVMVNMDRFLRPPTQRLFALNLIENVFAFKLARGIKVGKSSSIKHIRSCVLRDTLMAKPELLTELVNSSISGCIFPDVLKTASVLPLPKSGNLAKVTNWRPVSQINLFSKLIERVVHQQLMAYLLEFDIITDFQFGFMPGRSTSDAVFGLVQELYSARNREEIVAVVFLDLRKAFDTVDHSLMVSKLTDIGCDENTISWFRSYLGGRRQITVANDLVSECKNVLCGVPQGSVLGPLLFLIYMNDIVLQLKNAKFFMYADDLAVCVSGKDPDIIRELIQDDLNRLVEWCDQNKLTINCDKTKTLWCHSDRDYTNYNIQRLLIKNVCLATVNEFCYLGVIIDSCLSFLPHCKRVKSTSLVRLYQLRKLKKFMDKDLALMLYKTMVIPIFDYGAEVVDGAPELIVDSLQTVQNHCLRSCMGIKDPRDISRNDLHVLCTCKKLYDRRCRSLLGLMYKFSQHVDNVVVPPRVLRGNDKVKLKVSRPKANLYRKSPLYRGHLVWNKLDASVQHKGSKNSFLNALN